LLKREGPGERDESHSRPLGGNGTFLFPTGYSKTQGVWKHRNPRPVSACGLGIHPFAWQEPLGRGWTW
jgi:hypothetical protein